MSKVSFLACTSRFTFSGVGNVETELGFLAVFITWGPLILNDFYLISEEGLQGVFFCIASRARFIICSSLNFWRIAARFGEIIFSVSSICATVGYSGFDVSSDVGMLLLVVAIVSIGNIGFGQ